MPQPRITNAYAIKALDKWGNGGYITTQHPGQHIICYQSEQEAQLEARIRNERSIELDYGSTYTVVPYPFKHR